MKCPGPVRSGIFCATTVLAVTGCFAQASEPAGSAAGAVPESELLLSLTIDLSSEPDNASTAAARAVRTHWRLPGDQAEAGARIGNLRKELGAKYAMPLAAGPFSTTSVEARAADIRQYLDANRLFGFREATVRNLWAATAGGSLQGVAWGVEGVRLDAPEGVAPFLAEYVARQGRTTTGVPLSAFLVHDRRRQGVVIPEGHLTSAVVEWGTPAGTIQYAKVDASHQSYFPVGHAAGIGVAASFGRIQGLQGDFTPYAKRYLGGGVGSVRGYEPGALSPLDASGAATGADQRATVSAEALWHVFTLGQTPTVLSLFADRGGFSRSQQATVGSAYATSFGLGVTLPLRGGLIRAYFVQPRDEEYRSQRFQFEARASW